MSETTSNTPSGLAKPVTPDATLAAIIGAEPVPRAALMTKVWDYIKANKLQDEQDKRQIVADEKLKPLFEGADKINMLQLAKFVNNHVTA